MEVVELEPVVTDPLRAVVEKTSLGGGGPLNVVGLEQVISDRKRGRPALLALSLERSKWPERLQRPVILWIPEFLLEILGREAPDFVDWRSDTVHFPEERLSGVEAMDSSLWTGPRADQMPQRAREQRIAELESRLETTRESDDPLAREAQIRWLQELGDHLLFFGRLTDAEDTYRRAATVADELQDGRPSAASHFALSTSAARLGLYEEAENEARKSLEISESLNDGRSEVASCFQLGSLAAQRGDLASAEQWYLQSLGLLEELEDRPGMARSYHELGRVAEERSSYDEALDWYRKSLALLEELGDRSGMARSYFQLGKVAQERRSYREAQSRYIESLAISEELGDRSGMARAYYQLGRVAEERGSYDEALDWYRKSLTGFEELGELSGIARSSYQLGRVNQERRLFDEALGWYRKALTGFGELQDLWGRATSMSQIGIVLTEVGQPEQAVQWSLHSLAFRLELRVPEVEIDLHWLTRQREALGEERFSEIVREQLGEEPALNLLQMLEAFSGGEAAKD